MAAAHPLDLEIQQRFLALDTNGKIQAEYVWIGGSGQDLRSKCMTLDKKPESVADLRDWNFDGSSTGQAPGDDSEVIHPPGQGDLQGPLPR